MRAARTVHIDTDPGLDDLLALAVALASPEIELIGVTTVAGSAGLRAVTDNAQRFFALCRVDIPLGCGAATPRALSPRTAELAHGSDGRRGVRLPAIDRRPLPPADQILRRSLEHGVKTILALGPLTNLAALASEHPDLLAGVEIFWQGGSLCGGDLSPVAEANCLADPQALVEVGRCGRLHVLGLELTEQIRLHPSDFAEQPFGTGPAGTFLWDVVRAAMEVEGGHSGEPSLVLHEAAAVLAACDPRLFRFREYSLTVCVDEGPNRGRLRRDAADVSPAQRLDCRYAVEAHVPELQRRFRDRVSAWAASCA